MEVMHIWILAAIVVLVIFSAFFSGMEIAYISSNRLMLEIDKDKGGVKGFILGRLFRSPDKYITTMLVANNLVLVMYGLLFSMLIDPPLQRMGLPPALVIILDSVIATFFIIIFGEYMPKSHMKKRANANMQRYAPLVFFFYIIFYPITAFCTWLTRLFSKAKNRNDLTLAPKLTVIDLDHYLSSNLSSEGALGELETEVKIMQKAIDFSDLKARDCMIPRNEVVACSINTDLQTLRKQFVSTGLSKIIVYKDTIDEVLGYIHAKEIFAGSGWQQRMKKALFVPESIYGQKLMTELMASNRSLAVVLDELGGMAGIITLEDLVEEIFGEIEDEHDKENIVYRRLDDKTFVLSGRAEIDEINERFDIDLPEGDDYNTVAGFIISEHRSIPQRGEVVTIGAFSFSILRASSTRVELVKLTITD